MRRRDFLKIAGLGFISGLFLSSVSFSFKPTRRVRWGITIDVLQCKKNRDCKVCIEACHEIHNVPDVPDPKEKVMWIWTSTFEKAFENELGPLVKETRGSDPVLLLCNHCENPPCVKVCPTGATWKREDGIVMMDYHRCIGCRYCMAACPYGSRSFNWKDNRRYIKKLNYDFPVRTKGVVEKCNLCEERISKNLLPRCVEACPYGALTFGNLNDFQSSPSRLLRERLSIVRKPHLGTLPNVFYLL